MIAKPGYNPSAKQREAIRFLGGPQRNLLIYGGGRSGKTYNFVRGMAIRALRSPESRHAIFRLRYNSVRAAIWLDTLPKVMRQCFPDVRLQTARQDGFVEFPNKSQIWFGGLDDKERTEKVLGQEFATIYYNETSQIPYSSVLLAQTRLAQKAPGLVNRAWYDLNPVGTGHWTYRLFIEGIDPQSRQPLVDRSDYAHFHLNPVDNLENIDPALLKAMETMPERYRRRFLEGRYVAEIDGALWTLETIESTRVTWEDVPLLKRVVVAVDPSGCSGPEDKRSDEIGITVTGRGVDNEGYLLADRSLRASPEVWGRIAVEAFREFNADAIIGEKNFGGDMVRAVIHACDPNVPYKVVHATRGKVPRAEPMATMYEQKKFHNVGTYPILEDQMTNFSTAGYVGDRSPDRVDAAAWGAHELFFSDGSDAGWTWGTL